MLEITDQKVLQITKLLYNSFKHDDQRQRLDPDNLPQFKKQNIKPLYPHKLTKQGRTQKYTCSQACCTINPGNFCCGKTNPPDSSFKKLGLGLCLYFKFMKHSTIVFMLIAILTIVSCLVCFLVSNQNGFNPTTDYQTFLFSTTLGAFSSEHIKCQYQKLPALASLMSFTVSCPHGNVNLFGATYSNESSSNLYNCKTQIKRYESGDTNYVVPSTGQTINCPSGSSSCTITYLSISPQSSYTTIAYSYQCVNQVYSLGLYQVKSQYLLYFVVGIDLLCCIILAIFYYSESKSQQKQINFFKQSQLSLSDFSLKITGVNIATFDEQFNQIIHSLTKIIGQQLPSQIVQVKTPDRYEFVEYQDKKKIAYDQLYSLIVEEFFDHEINPTDYRDQKDFIQRNFSDGKYQIYKEKLSKYIQNYHFLEYSPSEEKGSKICSIFIVLNSIAIKKRIYQMQKDGCFSKYYQFNKKQYYLSQPPMPDLILWKNKGKLTLFRVILSWIITLFICGLSYMLFGWIQYQQNNYLSTYNFNINCNLLYTSNQLGTYTPLAGDNNYLTCYCLNNFLSSDSSLCSNIQKTYITYLTIPVIISLLLVVYNVIVSAFFKIITKFQCHRLVTAELFSFTIKRSFLLIMNMALIMIILNMKYSASIDIYQVSFLLQGKYNDLTPDWYINIGSIIILTMIFNITFPIFELLLANFLKCIKKCWDKKLCCKKTSCKTKNEYINLYSNDIYPIEQRYAFLISVLLITLAFSCVIPILNLICSISLMLLYFSDRVLVFKVFQTPANYGHQLHQLMNKAIYLGIISHFALSAFFLSQAQMLAPYSSISLNSALNSKNTRINSMITVYYIIPYVILFLIFAGWSIFNNTLIALCQKCLQLCKKSLSHITKYKLQQTFYDCLSSYQITKLKLIIQGELNKLTAKTNAYNSIKSNKSQMNQTMKGLTLNIKTNEISQQFPINEHQALLRRTHMRLKAQEGLRKRDRQFGDAYLIGLPSYQIMVNDEAFQENKKINLLNSGLSQALKDLIERGEG